MRKASTCRSERQISIGERAKERTKGRRSDARALERAAGERRAQMQQRETELRVLAGDGLY